MNESVVTVSGLTRRFGARTALSSVRLSVRRGAVHGLVGANGAGKTTLIKHLLGLLRAESGSVRVFGHDPVADPVAVLSRIGYLSEENDLPGWMRVDELIRYSRAFHPGWDDAYAEELRQTFALDPAAKIATRFLGVWPAGVEVPTIWPVLLGPALLAWTQALTWMPYPLPGLRVIVTIFWLATIDAIVMVALELKAPRR